MAIRQPATLYSTVLKNYTYEEIRNLCFTEGSTFTSAFDCEWKVWRDKAVADFAISEGFFDLVRSFASNGIKTLTGPQRYLQIASYAKLTPLSGVRVRIGISHEGVVEGVYEAVEGYKIAEERKDLDMVLWFANRIKPELQDQVKKLDTIVKEFEEKKARDLKLSFDKEGDDFVYLIRATKEGRVDILDNVIHDVFRLPEGFSIARDVPKHYNYDDTTFWKKKGYLLDLPLQELDETIEDFFLQDLLRTGFESGNTRIADFYLSIFRDKKQDIREAARRARFGYGSLLRHGNPEDAYGIALRTIRYKSSYDDLVFHMVEVALLLIQTNKRRKSQDAFLVEHMGDVTSIMAILPLCSKKDARRALNILTDEWRIDYKHLYPLSTMLLKQHYQTL
ncbi:hypothetical protein BQ9231_00448 [Cedratvirus lausannensis]|uniref:Uncharacterized protein n=1 Tax=Cedratvirus lausannensis TaxID=2023205 RepID=A0A285PXH2_9VIRU|nr:hypothetical protein BQ9231_00448 [Cedratvirus lausannensis]